MPPEYLARTETLSNIYSKRTILKEFSREHALMPLSSAQHYHIYIHGRHRNFRIFFSFRGGRAPILADPPPPPLRVPISILIKYSYTFVYAEVLEKCTLKTKYSAQKYNIFDFYIKI